MIGPLHHYDVRVQLETHTYGQDPAIQAMRGWLSDCYWADMDPEDFEELLPVTVANAVARHFSGGIAAFMLAEGLTR